MGLKHARLARAEHLSEADRKELGIAEGLIIIQTMNKDLRDEMKPISKTGGIREYLLSLGKFKDIDIS